MWIGRSLQFQINGIFSKKKSENHEKIETLNIEKTNYGVPEVPIYFCYLFQSDQEIQCKTFYNTLVANFLTLDKWL